MKDTKIIIYVYSHIVSSIKDVRTQGDESVTPMFKGKDGGVSKNQGNWRTSFMDDLIPKHLKKQYC